MVWLQTSSVIAVISKYLGRSALGTLGWSLFFKVGLLFVNVDVVLLILC